MMTTFRSDGLDNPLSPNSGIGGATWQRVEQRCEESDAVESYEHDGGEMVIEWCDGNSSRFRDPQKALIEIRQMEA